MAMHLQFSACWVIAGGMGWPVLARARRYAPNKYIFLYRKFMTIVTIARYSQHFFLFKKKKCFLKIQKNEIILRTGSLVIA